MGVPTSSTCFLKTLPNTEKKVLMKTLKVVRLRLIDRAALPKRPPLLPSSGRLLLADKLSFDDFFVELTIKERKRKTVNAANAPRNLSEVRKPAHAVLIVDQLILISGSRNSGPSGWVVNGLKLSNTKGLSIDTASLPEILGCKDEMVWGNRTQTVP